MMKKRSFFRTFTLVVACITLFVGTFFAVWSTVSISRTKQNFGVPDSSTGTAFAADPEPETKLFFNQSGRFKIAFITDIQDIYPMNRTTKAFICEVLEREKPDLVVLGGDNTVADYTNITTEEERKNASKEDIDKWTEEVKNKAVEELCDIFTSHETPFTLVFGNHDHEQGMDDDHLLKLYQKYGGKYCLAYDPNPELTGTATHNLVINSSLSGKAVFNLWMLDSNEYDGYGDGAVQEDQVAWYKERRDRIAEENGGKVLPSMSFQHIVDHCVMDKLFYRAPSFAGNIGRSTSEATYWLPLKRWSNYTGVIHELVCCGYYDHGCHQAFLEKGDMLACFSGHDHICNYTVDVDGIAYTNTSACTFHCYNEEFLVGCRIIDLDEFDLTKYVTNMLYVTDYAKEDDSPINLYGDMTQEKAKKLEKKRNEQEKFFFLR